MQYERTSQEQVSMSLHNIVLYIHYIGNKNQQLHLLRFYTLIQSSINYGNSYNDAALCLMKCKISTLLIFQMEATESNEVFCVFFISDLYFINVLSCMIKLLFNIYIFHHDMLIRTIFLRGTFSRNKKFIECAFFLLFTVYQK